MRLENRTADILQVVSIDKKGREYKSQLEANQEAYYGDMDKGEILKITSTDGGSATIIMAEDEEFYEECCDVDVSETCAHFDNILQLQDTTVGKPRERFRNSICIRITHK